jgi:xanthine dehydrogenase accessory factor
MRELLSELHNVLESGRACVYCALIETRGSTPQKAGAVMLVFPDGSQCGTLGGGCVEAEVKQRALRVLAAGAEPRPDILTFNLDSNYGWDDGLICGGRMMILADPLPEPTPASQERRRHAAAYYHQFRQMIEQGTGCTEAVVMNSEHTGLPGGSRYLFNQEGQLLDKIAEQDASDTIRKHLQPVQRRPKPYVAQGIAFLPQWPRITAFLIGAGHVGQAVAKLAAEVDFDVWVLDDRETFASKERFPTAERRLVGDIGQVLAQLVREEITPSHFCLIITRGHNHDEEALYHLARSEAGYVGMIGSKRKIKLIYEDLISRGVPRDALERVHAPLGFNIGSQTVPEIAVSIVAELIACRNLGATIPEARLQVKL